MSCYTKPANFCLLSHGKDSSWTTSVCRVSYKFLWITGNYLRDIKLPCETVLVKYVDDLLIASEDESACIVDTESLWTALAVKWHRASQSQLELCQKEVKYLSFILREGQWERDSEGIGACCGSIPASHKNHDSCLVTPPHTPRREENQKGMEKLAGWYKSSLMKQQNNTNILLLIRTYKMKNIK